MDTIKKYTALILLLTITTSIYSQNSTFSAIHHIEPIKNHYKDLKQLSGEKSEDFASMDDIKYPADDNWDFVLVYALNKPYYLSADQVGFITNSINFPANSSQQTRAELDFLRDLQNKRTTEQTERVLHLAKIGYWPHINVVKTGNKYEKNLKDLFFMANEVSEEKYNAKEYPKTTALLKGVMQDMRLMEFFIKFNVTRARPYHLDPNIKPLQEILTPSFASGHTLWAYIQAYTFSELAPEKRAEYIDLAYEIGLSREIMGVHFPSDEEAARQIAHKMLSLMWHTDKFQKDFVAAKKEWK